MDYFAKKRNSFMPLTDFGRCSIFDTSCLIYFQKNYNSVHQNSKWQNIASFAKGDSFSTYARYSQKLTFFTPDTQKYVSSSVSLPLLPKYV